HPAKGRSWPRSRSRSRSVISGESWTDERSPGSAGGAGRLRRRAVAEEREVEIERGEQPFAVDAAEREVVLTDELRRVRRRRAFSDTSPRVLSVVHEVDASCRPVAVHIDHHVCHDVTGLTAGDRLSCDEPGANAVAPAHRLAVARR